MNPSDLTIEDVENDPELAAGITAAKTAEYTLVGVIFGELEGYESIGHVHRDRFEYGGREWFVLYNASEERTAPAGFDVPPGKARIVVDGTNLAKLFENETGWMFDPDTGDAMAAASVQHEHSAGGDAGNAAAKTWMLRTVEALRWRVADAGGYDIGELASVETMLDDSVNRLQEVGE